MGFASIICWTGPRRGLQCALSAMEFSFTPKRLLVMAALLGIFALLGGFSNPAYLAEEYSNRMTKAWIYVMILFVGGAASASLIDHWVGLIDRSNIRWAYVVLGVIMMASALVWLHVLRASAEVS